MVATFTGSVLERRKDFAVMETMGAHQPDGQLPVRLGSGPAGAGRIGRRVRSGLRHIAFWIGGRRIPKLPSCRNRMLLLPVLLGSRGLGADCVHRLR